MEVSKNQLTILRCFGLDIHPETFSAALIQKNDRLVVEHDIMKVWNKIDMDKLEAWVKKNSEPHDICVVESGSNSFSVVDRIKECGRHAVVLESQRVSKICKAYFKADDEDAIKIGKVYLSGLANEVWVPDEKTKELRDIFASYKRATKDTTRTRNRLWGFLLSHGIRQEKKVSWLDDSRRAWILEQRDWSIMEQALLTVMIDDIQYAYKQRKQLTQIIAQEVSQNKNMLSLLRVVGIGQKTAFALVAAIGDISRFENPKKLVAYIGVHPTVRGSGKKTYRGHMSKWGHKDLKQLLAEGAQSVLRYGDSPMATWGKKLLFRKDHNVVIIALARKMVTSAWYILRGFGVNMEEVDSTLKNKYTKLAVTIGKETRTVWGYLTVNDFIDEKSKIYCKTS